MVKFLNKITLKSNLTTGHLINYSSKIENCDLCEETTKIYSILEEIKRVQKECCNGNGISLDEEHLVEIYERFIIPYINCDIAKIGSINDVIRLREHIKEELEKVTNENSKYILNILNDILTVIINAKNDKIEIVKLKNELIVLKEKYRKCKENEMILKRELDKCNGVKNKSNGALFSGSLGIKYTRLPPLIYFTACINLTQAWYKYLYPGCQIDPDNYKLVKDYIASFCSNEEAKKELMRLIYDKYKDDNGKWI
jgi:hypothetical protein